MRSPIKAFVRALNRLSLALRLTIIVGALLCSMLVSQAYGILSVKTLANKVKDSSSASGMGFLAEAVKNNVEIGQAAWAASASYSQGTALKEGPIGDITAALDNLERNVTKYGLETKAKEKAAPLIQTLQDSIKGARVAAASLADQLRSGKSQDQDIIKDCAAFADSLLIHSDTLSELQGLEKKLGSDTEAAATEISERNILIGSILFLVSLVSGFLSISMARSTSNQIRQISHDLANQSTLVVGQSITLNKTASNLSSNVNSCSASLVQTSASLEEVKSMVLSNQKNCETSMRVSQENQAKVQEGVRSVAELIEALQDLEKSIDENEVGVQKSYQEIGKITELIREIDEKTSIINDIVFQTKLLSFNASVEAARAGEHGRGFAVVAEEVGNLATMSGAAAKAISELLTHSTQHVRSLILSSQEQVEHLSAQTQKSVQICVAAAKVNAKIFSEVTDRVFQLNGMVGHVENSSREQSLGIEQISEAIRSLEISTLSNADDAEKTKGVGQSMNRAAQSLSKSITNLRMIVSGSAALKKSMSGTPPASLEREPATEPKSAADETIKPNFDDSSAA